MGSSSKNVVASDLISKDAKLGGSCSFGLCRSDEIKSINELSIHTLKERE